MKLKQLRIRKRKLGKTGYNFVFGLVLTAVMVGLIILGFFWSPYDPEAMQGSLKLSGPALAHVFGTDQFGRDVFSRILVGAGNTLIVALGTIVIGGGVGILAGAVTGYFGGWLDEILMRVNDALAAFPSVLLALVIISVWGTGKYKVMLALGIAFIPSFARIVRGEFLRCREEDYIVSARLIGVSAPRILFVHILPNIMPALLSALAIGFNNAVVQEAGMSYLGIGVQPPDASLGLMLSESQTYLASGPWCAIFPGIFLILLILGVNMLGEGILDRFGGGR
ncbi:ABC transporter permease [Muricomes intestini]|jgi:peptide/nickel transport system permease protein|uniref:Peptide/nickel transport system permease protein n=2 Tax=Muricomes intestini TaxID=1796634 RepID=A0A4R3KEF9_9FIRM|nr:ABC transporter permease [Muricomes intestini]TCS81726.1 peptide/nickel transport system permease protein [Muricomes intestini]HAX50548.1 peptide ABC transporter permease [Lachnospiraceae bacterium]HCR83474.1 peptide ABC transporter permease [Lachnospiraceae bacterium]